MTDEVRYVCTEGLFVTIMYPNYFTGCGNLGKRGYLNICYKDT